MDKIAQLQALLIKEPNDSFLQHALALEYIKINHYTEAQVLFENILVHNPSYIGSYYHLAQLYQQQDQIQQAQECYEKGMAIALSLGDQHSYNELQTSYQDLCG